MKSNLLLKLVFFCLLIIFSDAWAFTCEDEGLMRAMRETSHNASQKEIYEKHQLLLTEGAAETYGLICQLAALSQLNYGLENQAFQSPENAVLAAKALVSFTVVMYGEDDRPVWGQVGRSVIDPIHEKAVNFVNFAIGHDYAQGYIQKAHFYYDGIGLPKSDTNAFDQLVSASAVAEERETQLQILELMEILGPDRTATAALEAKLFGTNEESVETASQGTGFFVGPRTVLTAAHVVDGSENIQLIISRQQRVSATIETLYSSNDLATLTVEGDYVVDEPLSLSSSPQPGSDITVIGYPVAAIMGAQAKITAGVINAVSGPNDDPRLLQISAGIQAGSSGSPVFDNSGRVVGIVVSKLSDSFLQSTAGDRPQNVNFAIKSAYALPIIGEIHSAGNDESLSRTQLLERVNKKIVLISAH